MAWRVARSLDTLLAQLNAKAPRRSKLSDGSIGDAAHASRTSDHNPWLSLNGVGVVTARDYTHDPAGGLDCNWLAKALTTSGDKRIKYVIWNRRIWDPKNGWQAYKGANPHDHHLHLSVVSVPSGYDSTAPWALGASTAVGSPITTLPVPEDDMPTPEELWNFPINGVNARDRLQGIDEGVAALRTMVSRLPNDVAGAVRSMPVYNGVIKADEPFGQTVGWTEARIVAAISGLQAALLSALGQAQTGGGAGIDYARVQAAAEAGTKDALRSGVA